MDGVVKETLCTRCIHRPVCAYKEDFRKIVETTDKMQADINHIKMFKLTVNCYCYQSKPQGNIGWRNNYE